MPKSGQAIASLPGLRRLVDEGTSVRVAAKVLRCHHATLCRTLATTAFATGRN